MIDLGEEIRRLARVTYGEHISMTENHTAPIYYDRDSDMIRFFQSIQEEVLREQYND